MASEIHRIGSLLKHMQSGPSWHGAAVTEALSGVTASLASQRPSGQANTIWEIVLHMTAWRHFARRKLAEGEGVVLEVGSVEDWPPMPEATEAHWQQSLESLQAADQALRDEMRLHEDAKLHEEVPDKPYSYYVLLHGIVHHDAYHTGQISLLKKMLQA
ncbi:MAG: DinB family protein [Bacteroidota bacterium]